MIWDDTSRSKLIRPRLAVQVDPVWLLYLPVFEGIHSTACLAESNPFHSIPVPLSQWHSSRSEKKAKEVCWLLWSRNERGSHHAVLWSRARRCCKNQGFTWPVCSSLASSANFYIVKVAKTWTWDKLGAIWLLNSNELHTKIIETRCDNYTGNYSHQVFCPRKRRRSEQIVDNTYVLQ